MHYLTRPIKLQFELSSMCNALCLGCVRTDASTFKQKRFTIPDKQYISFETFNKIITAPEFDSVTELEFCGTIDDPLMHPQFLEFIEHAAEQGADKYKIQIHTNASLRNVSYWQRLANALQKFKRPHYLKFSIDGLADTNHIYRQNTTWQKIMENASAFINAGGNASWQYLIFPWNKHQVDEAKKLSVEMGFKEFIARHDRSIVSKIGLDDIKRKQSMMSNNPPQVTTLEDLEKQLEPVLSDDIICSNLGQQMYFISFDSKLWPCCFISNGFYTIDSGKLSILHDRLYTVYNDENWNDLTVHSVADVLSHSFYSNDLVDSWESNTIGTKLNNKIFRCAEVCSSSKIKTTPVGRLKA